MGLLVAIYLTINLALPLVGLNPVIKAYLIQPVLWVILIGIVRFLPGNKPLGKNRRKNTFILLAAGIASVQIFMYFIGGLFSGFGKSPSFFTPLGIAENIFFVGSMLLGMEFSRAWLMTHLVPVFLAYR